MFVADNTGVYGKIPAHGDFVFRNLPSNSLNVWDEWLQSFIAGSQEQLSDDWLDLYLQGPIWRMALSEGVLNENCWLGILVPSVDKVGRYFPLTVLTQVPHETGLIESLMLNSSWFKAVEELALLALDGELDVDALTYEASQIIPETGGTYRKEQSYSNEKEAAINMEFEEQSISSVLPQMMESLLISTLQSFSVWTTAGNDFVEPVSLYTQGLPSIGKVPALLDGRWTYWNWQMPFQLQVESESQLESVENYD